jgi:hypothetical protein
MEYSDDYQGRIARAMAESGLGVGALADGIGVTYQAIKKVVDGSTKMLAADNNVRAARLLGVNSEWLATGEGSPTPWPLSPELLQRIAESEDPGKIENELRVRFDLPLQSTQRKQQRAAA